MGMIEIGDDGVLHDAAWHRREGLRALSQARMAARFSTDHRAAEEPYRRAISHLVDAFLHDRAGQTDCFAHAHRAGAEVNALFGCKYDYDSKAQQYRLACPVFALHAYVGTSIAWTLSTACSICGAGPFQCDHIPGEEYDGHPCGYQPDGALALNHLALTPNPDFAYTWHWPKQYAAEELVADRVIQRPGDQAFCNHCQDCQGRWGPGAEDLDPVGRWRRTLEERNSRPAS
jgi:hypothetical protein